MKHNPLVLSYKTCILLLLVLVSLSACGRRGDPRPVKHYEKLPVQLKIESTRDAEAKETQAEPKAVEEIIQKIVPDPPGNLSAVYTGNSVVIAWDEVTGLSEPEYNVYRSSGGEFSLIGTVVIPAYTDRQVKTKGRYVYKVTSMGETESAFSGEIEVEVPE